MNSPKGNAQCMVKPDDDRVWCSETVTHPPAAAQANLLAHE